MKKIIIVMLVLLIKTAVTFCQEDNLKQAQYWYKNATEYEVGKIAEYARLALKDNPKEPQAYFLLGYGIAQAAFTADNGEGDEGAEEFEKWQKKIILIGIDTMKMALSLKPINGAEICWRISTNYSLFDNAAKDTGRVYLKKGAYEYPNDPYSEKCLFEFGDYESYINRYPKGENFRKAFFSRGSGKSINYEIELINEYITKYIDTTNITQEDKNLFYQRARDYYKNEQYENALKDYRYFINIAGDRAGFAYYAYNDMAVINENMKNNVEAITLYRKILEIYEKYIFNNKYLNDKLHQDIANTAKLKIQQLDK